MMIYMGHNMKLKLIVDSCLNLGWWIVLDNKSITQETKDLEKLIHENDIFILAYKSSNGKSIG